MRCHSAYQVTTRAPHAPRLIELRTTWLLPSVTALLGVMRIPSRGVHARSPETQMGSPWGSNILPWIWSIASKLGISPVANPLSYKGFGGARGIRTLDPSYPGYRISRSPERCARQGTPGHLIFRTASVRAPRGMRGNPRWDSVGTRDGMCLARPKQRYPSSTRRVPFQDLAPQGTGGGVRRRFWGNMGKNLGPHLARLLPPGRHSQPCSLERLACQAAIARHGFRRKAKRRGCKERTAALGLE